MHDLMRADKRLTIREVAKEQGISSDSCKGILTKHLGLRQVSAQFVPWLLTVKQKEHHVSVASDFLKCAGAGDNFFKNIVTCNETWIWIYDPETKQLSSQWITSSSPRLKKVPQVQYETNVNVITFFDQECIVHNQYCAQGKTAYQHFYLGVERLLCNSVHCT